MRLPRTRCATWIPAGLLLLACGGLAGLAAAQFPLQPERAQLSAPDQALAEAFERLPMARQGAVLAELEQRLLALDLPQVQALRAALALPAQTSRPPQDYPAFDPERFGPGKARTPVGRDSSTWRRVAKAFVPEPSSDLVPLVRFDYALGQAVAEPKPHADELRRLLNLLAGHLPDEDLARVRIVAALDAARPLAAQAGYFAHDYANLKGQSFRGLSLYDVWSQGVPLDVPDIDVRAFAELVEHQTGLPVPLRAPDKEHWYPRLSESVEALRAHVKLTQSLARTQLYGRPSMGAWDASIDLLQALHAQAQVDAQASGGTALDALVERYRRDGPALLEVGLAQVQAQGNTAWNRGNARRDSLERGAQQIRDLVRSLLPTLGVEPTSH